MDRPRTAHRRRRADSITVVDLIRRHYAQSDALRVPTGAERITQDRLAELLGPVEVHQLPQRDSASRTGTRTGPMTGTKTARTAKVVGLTVGAMALCGSVATAAAFAHHRPGPSDIAPAVLPTEVTGAAALRPDSLATALGALGATGTARPESTPTGSPSAGRNQLYRYEEPTGTTAGTTAPVDASPTAGPTSDASTQLAPQDVVRSFFQLVTTRPTEALALLAPSLLASPTDFLQSWSQVSQVKVESVRSTPDGAVQAVIRMLLPNGTWMRVVELLDVTPGNPPLINGADLLSAQRS
ncbi:MAG TPA: hypothetical protein VG317_00755 [Pseudonocardiaceae bacterium]|nr:hypothetical protein [Pseudonocardiaceae bacterium]